MSLDKKKLGEEQLKRALLMMKYDNRKTLTENVESLNNQTISEQDWGRIASYGAAGAAYGATAGVGVFSVPGAIIGGTIGIVAGLLTSGNSNEGAKKILEACNNTNEVGPPTQSNQELKSIADQINDAVSEQTLGFTTTNEEGIKNAIDQIKTIPDLCEMAKIYQTRHGENLFDAIDGDIDDEEEWKKYVFLPLLDAQERSEALGKNNKQYTKVEQNAIKCGWVNTDGGPDVEGYKNSEWRCPKTQGGQGGGGQRKTGTYKECKGTYTKGCKSTVIGTVQACLGLVSDGKFGPKTQSALESKGFKNGFTDADVDKICKTQPSPETPTPTVGLPTPDDEDNIDSLNV
jgi:hypothetical protein